MPRSTLSKYETLIDVLQEKTHQYPNRVLYTYLSDGETETGSLTYEQLNQKARAIAALLQNNLAQAGERVLLLYPPGLEFISAFWGCLYAGMIAVPCYPPRLNRPDSRLQVIAQDSQARAVLTTPEILTTIEKRLANTPELNSMHWLTTHEVDMRLAEPLAFSRVDGETIAFLQYTSGSTAQPKGVMISHGNLVHNLEQIHHFFGVGPQDRGVIWLPPYHDMGLIGGLLGTIYAGFSTILMPPTAFVQKPARWLQAISRYGGTISGAPNFAYDFCVEKIPDEQKRNLDLSSWEVAFSGAEPIHKKTLERFAEKFASCGFRRESLYACYGLAEATLIASGGKKGTWPRIRTFSGNALAINRVVAINSDNENARELVSCGVPSSEQEVLIVDPQSLKRCPDNNVGEIWLSGPSIAQGYWNRPEETAQTFQASLVDNSESCYLRTGDLGFLLDDELFIAGRAKDLIIIHGRNHYPQDIELTVESSHIALVAGGGAAFTVEAQGEERLVIIHEVNRHTTSKYAPAIIKAIRQAVAEHHELQVYALVLIRAGSIPRTSSFKIQRHVCRTQFQDGSLKVVASNQLEIHSPLMQGQQTGLVREELTAQQVLRREIGYVAPRTPTEETLAQIWAEVLKLDRIGIHDNFFELGGDSIHTVMIVSRIREAFGIDLPLTDLLEQPTVSFMAEYVVTVLWAMQAQTNSEKDDRQEISL